MQGIDLAQMLQEAAERNKPAPLEWAIQVARLRDHFRDMQKQHIFHEGQIVRLKAGIGDQAHAFIVVQILRNPPIGGVDIPGPAHEQGGRLNLRLAAINTSGQFSLALFESWPFEPVEDDNAA